MIDTPRDEVPIHLVASILTLPKAFHSQFLRFIDDVYPIDDANWPEVLMGLLWQLSVKKVREVPAERFAALFEQLGGRDGMHEWKYGPSIPASSLAAIRMTPEAYHAAFLRLVLAIRPIKDITPEKMIGGLVMYSHDDSYRILSPAHIDTIARAFELGSRIDEQLLVDVAAMKLHGMEHRETLRRLADAVAASVPPAVA
jgi:hypothetical protein